MLANARFLYIYIYIGKAKQRFPLPSIGTIAKGGAFPLFCHVMNPAQCGRIFIFSFISKVCVWGAVLQSHRYRYVDMLHTCVLNTQQGYFWALYSSKGYTTFSWIRNVHWRCYCFLASLRSFVCTYALLISYNGRNIDVNGSELAHKANHCTLKWDLTLDVILLLSHVLISFVQCLNE